MIFYSCWVPIDRPTCLGLAWRSFARHRDGKKNLVNADWLSPEALCQRLRLQLCASGMDVESFTSLKINMEPKHGPPGKGDFLLETIIFTFYLKLWGP